MRMTDTENTVYVPLWHKVDNLIKDVQLNSAIFELYYLRFRVPTKDELQEANRTESVELIKTVLSKQDSYIPLYDAYTTNVYVVQKRNVYIRVVHHDYRFPDELILKSVAEVKNKKLKRLAKHPELENDKVFMRSIRKIDLLTEFMGQFDLTVLYDTYLNVFYRYAPEIGNATYTCIRRSFIPHKGHLKPYYTKDEVLKLGMNMELIKIPEKLSYVDFKDRLSQNDYKSICVKIQENDVSSDILVQHQNYIVENNMVGLIQYYTIQGSYFMNQYLRGMTKYEYRNDYLEENIASVWNLVLNAPPFDNDYILYRFVSTDDYLKGIKINDIYQDKGFMSTTRDPFYRNDLYKFGFILIKIKIPKNIKGVGLCLETMSHFPSEEEIILPPLTKLRLLSKDDDCEYHHPDELFASNVKTRYEFEWVGNSEVKFDKRPDLPSDMSTQVVDFLEIRKVKTMTVKEKIDYVMNSYFDPMNRIRCTIGENTFYVVGEWYDSTGAYADMYSIKTSDGFSMYSLYKGYMLFMIEIGEIEGQAQIRVNYYTKYSRLDRRSILGDDNFIKFISSIAHYFEIPNVVVYADYMSCDSLTKQSFANSQINPESVDKKRRVVSRTLTSYSKKQRKTHKREQKSKTLLNLIVDSEADNNNTHMIEEKGKTQRTYMKLPDKPSKSANLKKRTDESQEIHDRNGEKDSEKHLEQTAIDPDEFTGGSYCVDFYRYLKYDEKRYQSESNSTLNAELQPMFSYYDLDGLKQITPSKVLRKEDRDEIYQIYTKNYLLEMPPEKDTLADLYIWMIENKCYLMDIYIKKMDRVYRRDNPFKKGMYILDAMAYLYNRRYVQTYSRYIKMMIDEEHQLLDVPKNEYRIRR
ncbi:ADP-ribosyltransferase exoenzyme domain protein [Yasminevirus sp. GU-2018]|uniref:ADP-ribosyltransferase exoenzyme domain protein n=1 Tax=Yasminevirus sp. GU-2018 TaxID=2420051 RepID=A0A5K0UA89_9VIRU|nr:ADP-ribosyltransferase exoenzyme domain protein [Yasminevirus sp. GU-2018]